MDAIQTILARRSIRQYTAKSVPDSVVTDLLRAAMAAPSAGNERPWHFIVIRERGLLDAVPRFHPYAAMLKQATVAIAVCGDLNLERHKGCWVQDCSAATENLLLAASAHGLGAVWTAIYPFEERISGLRTLLGLPDNIVPLSLVPLGYPVEYPKAVDRFDPGRVHQDKW